jgi:cytochrome c oxidase assembly factor CtaG
VEASLATEWPFEPLVLAGCLLALALFFQGFFRLRRRGRTDHAGWGRAALFVGAVALTYLALASPLAVAADDLLSAHMLEHLLLGDLAIALAMLAVRGPLVFFLLPPPVLARLARSPRLRAFLRWLTGPWVALAVWTASMWIWHIPRFYDYAAAHEVVHELEHLTFFLGGVLIWNLLIDPARTGRLTVPGRIALAIAVFMLGDFVMAAILNGAFTYPLYADQANRLLGLSPRADRQAAALLMLAEQTLTLGVCVGVLVFQYVKADRGPEHGTVRYSPLAHGTTKGEK